MAQLPFCLYLPAASGVPCCDRNAAAFQRFHDVIQDWSKGRVGSDNLDDSNWDPNIFYFKPRPNKPPLITIPALTPSSTDPHIEQKPPTSGTTKYGLDAFIDPSSVFGAFGIVDVRDPAKTQRIDLLIDEYTATNPGGSVKTPTGAITLDTGGAFDVIFKRNTVEQGRFDGTNFLVTPNIAWKSGTSFTGTLDHGNTANREYDFPDADVTVMGVVSGSGTVNVLPRFGATAGTLADSGLTDNGSAIISARQDITGPSGADFGIGPGTSRRLVFKSGGGSERLALDTAGSVWTLTASDLRYSPSGTVLLAFGRNDDIQLGSARKVSWSSTTGVGTQDASWERSAAGKLLLRDPSGGVTTPALHFHDASINSPAVIRSGTSLQVKLGDESNWTFLQAYSFIAKSNAGDGTFDLPNGGMLRFSSTTDAQGTKDLALYRNAAGIAEVNNGTAGTYRDLRVRYLGVGVAPGATNQLEVNAPASTAAGFRVAGHAGAGAEFGVSCDATPSNGVLMYSDSPTNWEVDGGSPLVTLTEFTFTINQAGNVNPYATNTYDLGTSSLAWKEIYTRKIDTDGAQTLTIQRNDVTHATLDGAFNIPVALSATGSTTTGDTRIVRSNQTASNGGSYSVAATVGLVFIDASALTAAQNFTVNLPSPVTYDQRVISVKVAVVGAATSTITIDSDAGNVEGAATQVWSASIRSGATFYSNGTDWYEVGQIGVA